MKSVLLDTDIILDFFFDRKPFSEYSAQILSLCESKEIKGYVTSVIISNVYYLLRQTASHDKVIEKLTQLITLTEVLTTSKEIIIQALNSKFKDFEDALQNYSAEVSENIDVVITRNTKDYKNSNLSIMTPETYIKIKTTSTSCSP